MLTRSVTKCNKACGRSLARLISHINQTKHDRQNCFVWHKIQDWSAGFFEEASFAGDLQDSINQLEAECTAHLNQKHVLRFLKCARNKQPCLTAVPNQKQFLWTLVSTAIVGLCYGNMFACRCQGKPHAPMWQTSIFSHFFDHLSFDSVDHVPSNIPQS